MIHGYFGVDIEHIVNTAYFSVTYKQPVGSLLKIVLIYFPFSFISPSKTISKQN